jgi:manganese-dependent inorganic pyrophosphatase
VRRTSANSLAVNAAGDRRRRFNKEKNMTKPRLRLVALALGLAVDGTAVAADPVLVVGHKNPDTDAIVSSLALAHLKSQQGTAAEAIAQGAPNAETQYVLGRFGLKTPVVQKSVAGRQVILVDHSDYAQAPDDLKKAEVVGLVDHHKLGGLATEKPIEAWLSPVGSTATVIARMYAAANQPVPKEMAGGLLAAILSDTVVFKSPTTTPEDRATAVRLASIAGVADIQALGVKLFEIKSDLKGTPPMQLLKQDLKDFDMGGRKVAVAQLEVMDLGAVLPLKKELLGAMGELKRDGYNSVLLMLTDVMKEGTELLVLSDDSAKIEAALGAKVQDSAMSLPGVMSRKKQVIPPLEKAFK